MPQAALAHNIDVCAQTQTFEQIKETLRRLDAHGERTAIALEHIAEQGAIVAQHEKRLDKHDIDLREVFHRVNDQERLERVEQKVAELEKKVAKEEGAEEVAVEKKKFWTDLKLQLATPIMVAAFFFLWLTGKLEIAAKLLKLWREFAG